MKLMHNEGLTSSRLAEILEIQPSGISHLLSGRNKPGFDFLQRMLRRFPRINPDWLLLDSNQMYRDSEDSVDNLSETISQEMNFFAQEKPEAPQIPRTPEKNTEPAQSMAPLVATRKDIERIVVFYSDHTFDSFISGK